MASARGRGRLSGIELLPDECGQIIAWAADELQNRERTQTDIYAEFVAQLGALQREHRGELDFPIPSFSAFNRYSIKLAVMTRRLHDTREIAATIADKFDVEQSDNLTLIAAEAIKTLIFELLTSAGESGIDPKGAMALANALRAASQAQGVSNSRRLKVEQEFAAKAAEAVKVVAKTKGISAEAADEILGGILGINK